MIIKYIFIVLIFGISVLIGNSISSKYRERINELKEFKSALNLLKAKIKYSYEPIPDIFIEISKKIDSNVGEVFKIAKEKMVKTTAGVAWENAIDEYLVLNINKEDKKVLKGLAKLLGKTNKEGQVSEIDLTEHFLDKQIEQAEEIGKKNEKMYKALGGIVGCALVIILI